MGTRLLICGDRNWQDKGLIRTLLERVRDDVECVIEGEAQGADRLAREAAIELGIPVLQFPADWELYGRAAGPIRNAQMLKEGRPTEVWAFHDNLSTSKGTADMVKRARKAGVPTAVYSHNATCQSLPSPVSSAT